MKIEGKIKLLKALYTANKAKDLDCDIDALFSLAGLKNQNQGTKEIFKTLTHRQCVLFAYNCALSVACFLKPGRETGQKVLTCLKLVEQWLGNPESVSEKELHAVAYAAYAAADAATYAANAAANAAYAAAYAADAATYAANAATYAAYAVADVANAFYDNPNKPEQAKKNLEILLKVLF